jgi:hypothetical protein
VEPEGLEAGRAMEILERFRDGDQGDLRKTPATAAHAHLPTERHLLSSEDF